MHARWDRAVYTAVAFTGGAGVSGRFGFGRGFATYLDDRRFAGMDYSPPPAVAWLCARAASVGPFFMFLHGYDVHGQQPLPGLNRAAVAPGYRGALDGSIEENARLREQGLSVIRTPGEAASLRGPDEVDGESLRRIGHPTPSGLEEHAAGRPNQTSPRCEERVHGLLPRIR
jgi:hypothetical protein